MNNIIFSDWYEHFKEIHNKFKKWWHDKIHILADFDRTLTKNFVGGQEKPSLVSVLRHEWILWEDYSKAAHNLFEHYHPLEVSSKISLSDKKRYMDEWWHKHMQLLVDTGIHKDHISEALWWWKLQFREWMKTFINFLEKHNIPLVIISANALGTDSIRTFFQLQWLSTKNIHIISNEFEWNSKSIAIWYKQPVIHVCNKDETVLRNYPEIIEEVADRANVILLWDSEGDPGMIEWFEYENLLKIWFLNKDVEKLEQRYRKLYDVIVCDDGNLDVLNTFLANI